MIQMQLEKLVINAVVNPLTVIFQCYNGELLHNFTITRIMRLLLQEISPIITSLPELQGIPNIPLRFSAHRLESIVRSVALKTKDNISSMLQDVNQGRETEIEYINGYIVRRGQDLGLTCSLNYMVVQMVKARQLMVSRQLQDEVPLRRDDVPTDSVGAE
jgi:2-dehydropantoate 2-reductase